MARRHAGAGRDPLGCRVLARRVVPGRARARDHLKAGVLPGPPRRAGTAAQPRAARRDLGTCRAVHQATGRPETMDVPPGWRGRGHDEHGWRPRRGPAAGPRLEQQLAAAREPRYRHIVVDEAQDLSSAHWMLLRAMGGRGPNDLFLVLAEIG